MFSFVPRIKADLEIRKQVLSLLHTELSRTVSACAVGRWLWPAAKPFHRASMFLVGLGVLSSACFPNVLAGMGMSPARKMVFDTPEEDPNYNPLPEDRPDHQPRDQDQNQQQHAQ